MCLSQQMVVKLNRNFVGRLYTKSKYVFLVSNFIAGMNLPDSPVQMTMTMFMIVHALFLVL